MYFQFIRLYKKNVQVLLIFIKKCIFTLYTIKNIVWFMVQRVYSTEPEQEQAKWNMAQASLMRMDELLQACNYHSQVGNFIDWKRALVTLYREVSPFIAKNKKEVDECEKLIEECNTAESTYNRVFQGYERFSSAPLLIYQNNFFTKLNALEITLRRLMQEHRLIIPIVDDSGL